MVKAYAPSLYYVERKGVVLTLDILPVLYRLALSRFELVLDIGKENYTIFVTILYCKQRHAVAHKHCNTTHKATLPKTSRSHKITPVH